MVLRLWHMARVDLLLSAASSMPYAIPLGSMCVTPWLGHTLCYHSYHYSSCHKRSSSSRLIATHSACFVVMYDRDGELIMRVFSSQSEDEDWDIPLIAELPDNIVVDIGSPVVVHGGAIHWICGTPLWPHHTVRALAMRITEAGTSVYQFNLPSRAGMHHLTDVARMMRLVNSAQGVLSLVLVDELVLSIWNMEDNNANKKRWSCCKAVYLMPMLQPIISCCEVKLSIQGLCEKSGSLFMHVVGEGIFVLKLERRKAMKVCKGHFTKYLCPYVTDFDSCIKAMADY